MHTFKITQNDTYPAISGVVTDEDGSPVDITGASVRFIMSPVAGSSGLDANGAVIDGAAGSIAYQWVAGDTATPGSYFAEFEVTYADGNVESFPSGTLIVHIRPEQG